MGFLNMNKQADNETSTEIMGVQEANPSPVVDEPKIDKGVPSVIQEETVKSLGLPENLASHLRQSEEDRTMEAKACCEVLGIQYIPKVAELNLSYLRRCVESKRACADCEKAGALQACCIRYGMSVENGHYYESMGNCPKPLREARVLNVNWSEEDIGLPRFYRDRNFENFAIKEGNAEAVEFCKNWLRNFEPGAKGLYITGPSRVGKTHLIAALIHGLMQKNVTCKFTNISKILEFLRQSLNNPNHTGDQFKKMLAEDVEVLFLDALRSSTISRWAKDQIFDIIERRAENGLTTVVSTNESQESLRKAMHPSLVEILLEICDIVNINDKKQYKNLKDENTLPLN